MQKTAVKTEGVKFIIEKEGKLVGRVYLYFIHNDLHAAPYGLMEDLFVEEQYRGQGIGKELIQAAIDEAKARRCTKLIAQSRYGKDQVHAMYEGMGFKNHGYNFRIDFEH